MKSQQKTRWQTILNLTQQMRELAKPNESLADLSFDEANADQDWARQPWQKIAELDTQRLQLLKAFFANPVDAADQPEIEQGIADMLQSDLAVQKIGQSIKKQIGQNFSALGHAQRVASAYASNASD